MLLRIASLFLLSWIALGGFASEATAKTPLRFEDGFLWLEARTSKSERPLRFVLDSGASRSVLDLATARELKLPLKGRVDVQGVNSRVRGHWPAALKARTESIALPSEYLALDLSGLSGKCASHIDGLIGMDFFKNRIVQIDFETLTLRILDSVADGHGAISVPMQTRPCGMRIAVAVNGREEQWMRLDTGCVSPLQWVAPQIRPEECLGHRVAVGLTQLSLPETETSVQLGAARFEAIKTGIHAKPIFPGEAGLVGLGLLKNFKRITIDSPGHRLVLTK